MKKESKIVCPRCGSGCGSKFGKENCIICIFRYGGSYKNHEAKEKQIKEEFWRQCVRKKRIFCPDKALGQCTIWSDNWSMDVD